MSLDQQSRAVAQRRFRIFWIMNAAAVAFLLDDVLILYGVRLGLPEPALAAVASFVQLTMPFMILGRIFTARWGLARGWVAAYLVRYPAVLLLVAAPWVHDTPGRTALFLTAAFIFAAFRAVGVINMHPLNGEITSDEERGRYLHGNFALFNLTYMAALAFTVLATRRFASIWIFQLLVALGAVIGMASLVVLRIVPESGEGHTSARERFLPLFRRLRSEVRLGVLIPAWAGGLASFTLVMPFAIILVKGGYGVDDHTALLFSLTALAGAVASGLVNRRLTDRVAPQRLVSIYVGTLLVVAGAWSFAPSDLVLLFVVPLFFAGGVARAGIIVGLQHVLIAENKPEHRMHIALMAELAAAAIAGLTGTIVGGGLLAHFGARLEGIDVYRAFFRAIVPLIAVALFFAVRLGTSRGRTPADHND